MTQSVVMKASIVAMLGWIIPAPGDAADPHLDPVYVYHHRPFLFPRIRRHDGPGRIFAPINAQDGSCLLDSRLHLVDRQRLPDDPR